MDSILKIIKDYSPGPFKIWLGPYLGIVIVKPEDVQVIIFYYNINKFIFFENSKCIKKKGNLYIFILLTFSAFWVRKVIVNCNNKFSHLMH